MHVCYCCTGEQVPEGAWPGLGLLALGWSKGPQQGVEGGGNIWHPQHNMVWLCISAIAGCLENHYDYCRLTIDGTCIAACDKIDTDTIIYLLESLNHHDQALTESSTSYAMTCNDRSSSTSYAMTCHPSWPWIEGLLFGCMSVEMHE